MALDFNSPTWIALTEHIGKELITAGKALEIKGTDPVATEFERGRIKALRTILDLAKPSKLIPG